MGKTKYGKVYEKDGVTYQECTTPEGVKYTIQLRVSEEQKKAKDILSAFRKRNESTN